MKRFLLLIVLFVASLAASAQVIYSTLEKRDRFDDVLSKRTVKTIISLNRNGNDDEITIETKGSTPKVYVVIGDPDRYGSADEPENLTADIYGYETNYFCVPKQNVKAMRADVATLDDITETDVERLNKTYGAVNIVLRTGVTQYTHTYLGDVAWIEFNDGSRTIYKK